MTLTFTTENSFVLQNADTRPEGFYKAASGACYTKNIKAAARFRSHADSRAERIFKKFMLQNIDLPAGGVLSPPGLELYDFQKDEGVPFILSRNRSYLAHQPGLGKSAQAICAVNSKPGPTLIIAPSFLTVNWAREITKWSTTDFPLIQIVPETEKQFKMNWASDFIICSDAMLTRGWVRAGIQSFDRRFTFIDEGHRFKTQDASRTIALFGGKTKKLASRGLIYDSEHVCILSGTPLLNRPIELWPMLYAMAPEVIDFMPYADFGMRYGGATKDEYGHWRFVGSTREDELKQRLMGTFMQRKRKRDVLKDLPDKVREVIVMDVDPRDAVTRKLDKELQRDLRRRHLEGNFEPPEALGDWATLRHDNGTSKISWVAEFVNNVLASDVEEQVLLFAHHRDVVAGLASALGGWGPVVINGGVSMTARTKIEDAFQAGKRRIIIGNMDAMNLGLTLTNASRVIFAEYSWTPSVNEQAEDRAHRIGQHDSVFCQYLVLPNSIDEIILNSVMVKEEKIAKVLD